ncbi:unnamed protein product [Boreogadus saida]
MDFSGFSLSLASPGTLPGPSSCLGCCKRTGQLEDWEDAHPRVIRHPDEEQRYTDPAAFGDRGGRGIDEGGEPGPLRPLTPG